MIIALHFELSTWLSRVTVAFPEGGMLYYQQEELLRHRYLRWVLDFIDYG